MSVAMTGASGKLGRRIAELVLEQPGFDPSALVTVSRRPEALADLSERGAEARGGDFDAPETLVAAFAGVERLLLVSTDAVGRRVPQHRAAIDAAVAAGVRWIGYTSVTNPTRDNPALVATEHRATEEALRASGLAWTALRNSLYSELYVDEARGAAATGTLPHNRGDGRWAPVSREDCAAVAAAVLTRTGADVEVLDVTGPELLDAEGLAERYAAATGVAVTGHALDDEAYAAALEQHELPAEVAALITSFGRGIREGHFAVQTDVVAELTGRAPRSIVDVLSAAPATSVA